MKKITGKLLKKWTACDDGLEAFLKLFKNGATLKEAEESTLKDSYKKWLWCKCSDSDSHFKDVIVSKGNQSTSKTGHYGIAMSGHDSKSYSESCGISISKSDSISIAKTKGIAISDYRSTSIVGDFGIAITDLRGISVSKYKGLSITGTYGKAQSGRNGTIMIKDISDKYIIGCIGENGLEPNTLYELDKNKKFVKCYNQEIIQQENC